MTIKAMSGIPVNLFKCNQHQVLLMLDFTSGSRGFSACAKVEQFSVCCEMWLKRALSSLFSLFARCCVASQDSAVPPWSTIMFSAITVWVGEHCVVCHVLADNVCFGFSKAVVPTSFLMMNCISKKEDFFFKFTCTILSCYRISGGSNRPKLTF